MGEFLIPLAILAMFIIAAIFGATWLVWICCSERVDARRDKRPTKGRRRGDQ